MTSALRLPRGARLSDQLWHERHRIISGLLWLHVPALALLGLISPMFVAIELPSGALIMHLHLCAILALVALYRQWGQRCHADGGSA